MHWCMRGVGVCLAQRAPCSAAPHPQYPQLQQPREGDVSSQQVKPAARASLSFAFHLVEWTTGGGVDNTLAMQGLGKGFDHVGWRWPANGQNCSPGMRGIVTLTGAIELLQGDACDPHLTYLLMERQRAKSWGSV